MPLGQEVKTWSFRHYTAKLRGKLLARNCKMRGLQKGLFCYMIDLHFFCLESGGEQSSSARYNMVTDKQEVITQRFRNRTVRNDEIGLLLLNAALINCYSSEYKDMVISGRTQRNS